MHTTTCLKYLVLAVVILGLSACSSSNDSGTRTLETTLWEFLSYAEQGNVQPILTGTTITAVFDRNVGNVYGSAGCNQYSGGFQAENDTLSVSQLAVTDMFCDSPEGVMEQEQRYLTALEAAERFEAMGTQLQILSSNERILLFRAQ